MPIEKWYKKIKEMGEEDIPMEIDGKITTPKEYVRKKGYK